MFRYRVVLVDRIPHYFAGIANSLDLTDRILPRLQMREKCKPTLLNFPPYTKEQIITVLTDRLSKVSTVLTDRLSQVSYTLLTDRLSKVSTVLTHRLSKVSLPHCKQ